MPQVLPFVGPALGAAGLLMNQDQGRRQQNAQNDANALGWEGLNWQKDMFRRFQEPGLQALLGMAQNYDPVAESRAATDYAGQRAGEALDTALRGFRVSQARGGATPGNSSMDAALQARAMQPATTMLAGINADAAGNATAKRAAMWQAALGQAPAGNIGQSYFQMANQLANSAQSMPGANYAPSSQLLAQGLQGLFKPQGGAGGRGDTAANFFTGDFGLGAQTPSQDQRKNWWEQQ